MPQGATSGQQPKVENIQQSVPPVATAGNSQATDVAEVPGASGDTYTVTSVSYTPAADITGVNTNTRLVQLINAGTDGNATTVVASLQFNAGVNAFDDDEIALTLSGTPANLVVSPSQILRWESNAVGTGITDPGGLAQVVLDRD
jgi:hypothetical protein